MPNSTNRCDAVRIVYDGAPRRSSRIRRIAKRCLLPFHHDGPHQTVNEGGKVIRWPST